jgi:hypothetical protein
MSVLQAAEPILYSTLEKISLPTQKAQHTQIDQTGNGYVMFRQER